VFVRQHAAQNQNLLNRNNELFSQITRLIEMMAAKVAPDDLRALKRHWTIHFLAQRIPRLVRQAVAGQYGLARSGLNELPMGITPLAVIAAYPVFKFNLPPARMTAGRLLARICEMNHSRT